MFTLCAEAPMILPIRAITVTDVKNHRRPKISDSLPTSANPTAAPVVQDTPSQMALGEGPKEAITREMVFAGSTQPR